MQLVQPQVASLVHGRSSDPCWQEERDRVLIDLVDALHEQADVDDNLWRRVSAEFTPEQVLDLLLLCGWYRAISYVARGLRIDLEPSAPRFSDYG